MLRLRAYRRDMIVVYCVYAQDIRWAVYIIILFIETPYARHVTVSRARVQLARNDGLFRADGTRLYKNAVFHEPCNSVA